MNDSNLQFKLFIYVSMFYHCSTSNYNNDYMKDVTLIFFYHPYPCIHNYYLSILFQPISYRNSFIKASSTTWLPNYNTSLLFYYIYNKQKTADSISMQQNIWNADSRVDNRWTHPKYRGKTGITRHKCPILLTRTLCVYQLNRSSPFHAP